AVFLLFAPLTIIAALSIRTAHKIKDHGDMGEDLCRKLSRHRIVVQVIGMISIVVTAMWGMLQNFNISPLG
ncbi:MAG: component of SufBCD complex, partial [Albidovulum sp.]